MTGNTKVWRAPLAGLASVAMLATMGVAASTANAATATPQYDKTTVTLDANGGNFASSFSANYVDAKGKQISVTDTPDSDTTGYEYTDGVFDGLYKTYGTDSAVKRAGYVFTGWYTSPDAGGQAVDPQAPLQDGETLYAHWKYLKTDESETGVKFDVNNNGTPVLNITSPAFNPDGASSVVITPQSNIVFVRLADGDQVADWQVPTAAEDIADGRVFTGWDKDVASAVRGTTLTAQVKAGVKVKFGGTSSYGLYKDGVKANASGKVYDVERNATLTDYQAVKNVDSASVQLNYAWKYGVGSATSGETQVAHGQSLNVPEGVSEITVTPTDFQGATEYRVNPVEVVAGTHPEYTRRYFTPQTSSFVDAYGQDKLDDLARTNVDTFLGWYNYNATFQVNGTTKNVRDYFNNDGTPLNWDTIKPVVPPTYDFTTIQGPGVVDLFAGYDAAAKYVTVTVHPLYDQAKDFTVKFYTNKTVGAQLKALEASGQLNRDGYSVSGWYTKLNTTAAPYTDVDASSQIKGTTLEKLFGDTTYPVDANATFDNLYVTYSADAKYGKNGLRENLIRGLFYTKVSGRHTHYAKVSDANNDGTFDVPTGYTSSSIKEVKLSGYTEASWKDFVSTRKTVVNDLLKYFKLSSTGSYIGDIEKVFEKVTNDLSAEKADEFNQEFGGKLAANTQYPDVNYDDANTHADEVTALTSKGIIKGYADGTFGYGAPVARVDYIVWLYRAAGSPAVSSTASFSDVTAQTVPNKEFRDAIAWAAAQGITKGYSDGTFAPYASIARQDAMAFLYRAAGSPKFNESYADVKFSDVTPGDSANHSQAVLWAASEGIAKGYSGTVNKFAGLDIVVRQDAAAFLARAINGVNTGIFAE